jgi:hypothetical protein
MIRYNGGNLQLCNGSAWQTLTAGSGFFANGGNSFAGAATLGTNDAYSLNVETNGTTRMTFDNAGNIGIGVTSPSTRLDIASSIASGNIVNVTSADTTTGVLNGISATISSNGTGSSGVYGVTSGGGYSNGVSGYASNASVNSYAVGVYGKTSGGSGAGVKGVAGYQWGGYQSHGGDFLALGPDSYGLYAENSAASGNAIALYATSSGNAAGYAIYSAAGRNYFSGAVGIGVATPSTKLHVNGTLQLADGGETCSVAGNGGMIRYNSNNLQFCNGTSWQTLGVSGAGSFANGGNSFSGAATLGTNDGYSLSLKTNNTNRMTILSSGEVGLGTSSPVDPLSFGSVNASSTHSLVNLSNTALSGASANGTYIGANPATASADFMNYQVAGTTKFGVDKNGRITGDGSGLTGVTPSFSGLTAGGALFATSSTALGQDASNFFWDSTNHRLGIGTTSPQQSLDLGSGHLQVGSGSKIVWGTVFPTNISADSSGIYFNLKNSATVDFTFGSNFTFQPHAQNSSAAPGFGLTVGGGAPCATCVDQNGGTLILTGGDSRGTGTSQISFKTAPAGSSGSGLNSAAVRMTIDGSGNVGIGTSSPRAALDVTGAIVGTASSTNATSTIDFSSGNIQHTTASCGSFSLRSLKDGGTYMFIVKGTSVATCSFTAYSDAGTATPLTVHLPPNHGATTSGKHTIYNLAVSGGDVYLAWTPGY